MPSYTPDDERFLRDAMIELPHVSPETCLRQQIASLQHQQCLLRAALEDMKDKRNAWRYWCVAGWLMLIAWVLWRKLP